MNKRGMKRKTTEEEDKLIVQKGRKQFYAPVRVVLSQLNQKENQPPDRREPSFDFCLMRRISMKSSFVKQIIYLRLLVS